MQQTLVEDMAYMQDSKQLVADSKLPNSHVVTAKFSIGPVHSLALDLVARHDFGEQVVSLFLLQLPF
jgi:hypothetical protein